jgi:hypothetical protein
MVSYKSIIQGGRQKFFKDSSSVAAVWTFNPDGTVSKEGEIITGETACVKIDQAGVKTASKIILRK